MMMIRRSDTLGVAHSGGLTVRCHFAFADYKDPIQTHAGCLRVLNLVTLPPAKCYEIGPEAGIDILTWMQSGTLVAEIDGFEKEDVSAGGLHLMSTGAGCKTLQWTAGRAGASFIQFWLLPDIEGTLPAQESRSAFPQLEDGSFRIIASGFPEDDPEEVESVRDGAPVTLCARARLLHAELPTGEGAAYRTTDGRALYLLVVSGAVRIGTDVLDSGDAMSLTDVTQMTVIAVASAVVLLADVAA
ncbi:pirin family protein [Acetobacter conturbans]|uniref:Quercetin 2,3-dioxygenase C-terminal cupin domain-containing protein n=1 Tax=Acetobacter conturbans TaxID=1737472 RepID=A0ABX0K5C6_9PROT|nr:hypothetical protein [Acetobacter conturbans]NHN89553.1 hypothetical protein [Acetobacter conturbans]